jgi:hypothetical protein
MGSVDNLYEKDKLHKKPGDPNKRDFTYFVLGGARFIYASAARLVALKVRARRIGCGPWSLIDLARMGVGAVSGLE